MVRSLSRAACSRAMMLPTISFPSQILGEPGSCPATLRTAGFILLTAKPKKLWQPCHRLWETLRKTNNIFLCYLCLLAQRKIRGSFPAKAGPLAWRIWRRSSLFQSFSEKFISLSIWTRTTKDPEKPFFWICQVFIIHSESKYFC